MIGFPIKQSTAAKIAAERTFKIFKISSLTCWFVFCCLCQSHNHVMCESFRLPKLAEVKTLAQASLSDSHFWFEKKQIPW